MKTITLKPRGRYSIKGKPLLYDCAARPMGSPTAYWRGRNTARRSLISTFKLEMGCADCGYAEAPEALDFDHRDPATKVNKVGSMLMGSLERLVEEMEKCDVVCANCHRIRTNRT